MQCQTFCIQNCTMRYTITCSPTSAKRELSYTMQHHDGSISVKTLMSGGNKKSYVLKQTCSFQLQVCLSAHDLLLPLGIKGLKLVSVEGDNESITGEEIILSRGLPEAKLEHFPGALLSCTPPCKKLPGKLNLSLM